MLLLNTGTLQNTGTYICKYHSLTVVFTERVRSIFKTVNFSEEHTNERMREESTYMFFLRYLEELEEGKGNNTKPIIEQVMVRNSLNTSAVTHIQCFIILSAFRCNCVQQLLLVVMYLQHHSSVMRYRFLPG